MRIAGNYTFEASREEIWSALNDSQVLAQIIPGCQRFDQIGTAEYETTLKVGLQAVHGVYSGRIKLENVIAPESYDIYVDGKGSNGFLKGNGTIKLRIEGETTILDYGGEAQIGGAIASVGQRLIDNAAKTLIHQSLKMLATQVELRRYPSAVEAAPPAPPLLDIEQRTITVPAHEQLRVAVVARDMAADVIQGNLWMAWTLLAFLIGYLLGRRKWLSLV